MVDLVATAVVERNGVARVDDKGGEKADLVDVFETTPGVLRSTFMLKGACSQAALREVPELLGTL